jgi:hypothetical protein
MSSRTWQRSLARASAPSTRTELVQVPFEVLLELLHRLPVDPGGSLVGLDPLVCRPYHFLRDRKWFRSWLDHRLLLTRQLTADRARMAGPLHSTRVTGLRHYYGTVRHCMPRHGTLPLPHVLGWGSPSRGRGGRRPPLPRFRGRSFPRSALAPGSDSRRLYAGCRPSSEQVSLGLVAGLMSDPLSTSSQGCPDRAWTPRPRDGPSCSGPSECRPPW